MLIQLVGCTLRLDNRDTLRSDSGGTGYVSKVTCRKLKKLIQPVLICRTLRSGKGGTHSAHNSGTGRLHKFSNSKLEKLIEHVLIQLVNRTLHSDNCGTLC